MKKKFFLLFSHNLMPTQKTEIEDLFGIEEIIKLPSEFHEIWSNIPPEPENIENIIAPVKKWLLLNASKNDLILIQGDFGATYQMVNWCLTQSFIPVYATSKRVHEEEPQPDGTIKISKSFKHVRFRNY